MLKLWNFSSTLGRPNSEEKERKRRMREAQLQQIQRELTLDRKLISSNWPNSRFTGAPSRSKTFRHASSQLQQPAGVSATSQQNLHQPMNLDNNNNNLRFRSKSSHKLDDESQFVSRLRFLDDSNSRNISPLLPMKRHSSASAFLTPDDNEQLNKDIYGYGMRRRYTTAFDSEDTDFTTTSTSESRGQSRPPIVTFANNVQKMSTSGHASRNLRFSDDQHSGHSSDDGFGDPVYRSDKKFELFFIMINPSLIFFV